MNFDIHREFIAVSYFKNFFNKNYGMWINKKANPLEEWACVNLRDLKLSRRSTVVDWTSKQVLANISEKNTASSFPILHSVWRNYASPNLQDYTVYGP
jgi:hypothetical protein